MVRKLIGIIQQRWPGQSIQTIFVARDYSYPEPPLTFLVSYGNTRKGQIHVMYTHEILYIGYSVRRTSDRRRKTKFDDSNTSPLFINHH